MPRSNVEASSTRSVAVLLAILAVLVVALLIARVRAESTSRLVTPAAPTAPSAAQARKLQGPGHSNERGYFEQLVILRNSNDAQERIHALPTLSTIRTEEAGPALKDEAVRLLEQAIWSDHDPYVRERAVFALANLSARDSVPLLRELALRDRDPNVRSAAMANLQLVKERHPEPAKAEFLVETSGTAQVGGIVTVEATLASRVDVGRARLLMTIPPSLEVLSGERGWEGGLKANQPQLLTLPLRVKDAGTFQVYASLRLSGAPLDYELTDRIITLNTDTGAVRVESVNRHASRE